MTPRPPHVCVCICTYKRPTMLGVLLDRLSRQTTRGEFTWSAVIVDNDPARSAEAVVTAFAERTSDSVSYQVESRQGIARARNAAIDHASGDYVAFIDDDEYPADDWLMAHLAAIVSMGVDGTLGPVMPHFEDGAPVWLRAGGFFDRPRHPTGMRLASRQTRTGNVLMKRSCFDSGERFDPNYLAASDQELFGRMMDRGCVFAWCDEAVVHEVVPKARWSRAFLIRKALFQGAFAPSRFSPPAIARSVAAIPIYAAALPCTVLLGQAASMKCAFKLCYHTGRLCGVLGINPVRTAYVSE